MNRAMPWLVALTFPFGCEAPAEDSAPADPYVLVLGVAQDAGRPQIGCRSNCCESARRNPDDRRFVTSLLLADPRSGKRWLLDATPDLREQVEVAEGHPVTRKAPGPRPPLFEGVFLTHAHMGHYTGLLQLGPEAYNAQHLPLYGTERMEAYLSQNGPWNLLLAQGNWDYRTMVPGEAVSLAEDLTVTAILVPHRREFTDTCAFLIRGPRRSLLYLPDIDKWDRWDTPIEEVLAQVDVALLDGAFFADGEIPGRSIDQIPHPFISETLERLAPLPRSERAKVVFTHLNHTNPALDEDSAAALTVREAGMAVARRGTIYPLGK